MIILTVVSAGLFAIASFELTTSAASNTPLEILPAKPWPHLPFVKDDQSLSVIHEDERETTTRIQDLPPAGLKSYLVSAVIDGSTLIIDGTTRVRLAGIKAPDKDEEYGLEATDFLRSMVEHREILLLPDSENTEDDFGRLRGIVYLERKNINIEMLRAGLAHEFPVTPSLIRAGDFTSFETEAKQAQRGLWGGERYYNTLTGEKEDIPKL